MFFIARYTKIVLLRICLVNMNKSADLFTFTLRRLMFADIYFHGCKFCHISRRFIFAGGEILIISRGLIFAVAKKAVEKQIFAKFTVPIKFNIRNALWKLYLSGKFFQ